jgi:hypothetical protein
MNRHLLICAAALLGAAYFGCSYQPICPEDYVFDSARAVCVFQGDAGGPPGPRDSGMGVDANDVEEDAAAPEDAATAEDAGGEADAGSAGDAGTSDAG